MKTYTAVMLLGCCLAGCSKGPQATPPDYTVRADEVAGEWVLAGASPAVQEVFLPHRFATSRFFLNTNGMANYTFLPREEAASAPGQKMKWVVDSGGGTWELRTWQEQGRGVWRVNLLTQAGGVAFRAEKGEEGRIVLAYHSGSDTNAALVFRRANVNPQ